MGSSPSGCAGYGRPPQADSIAVDPIPSRNSRHKIQRPHPADWPSLVSLFDQIWWLARLF
jgi:hypothetical protein